MEKISWKKRKMDGSDLHGQNLEWGDFTAISFRSADFKKANLVNSRFRECDFTGADFRGANLRILEDVSFAMLILERRIFGFVLWKMQI